MAGPDLGEPATEAEHSGPRSGGSRKPPQILGEDKPHGSPSAPWAFPPTSLKE